MNHRLTIPLAFPALLLTAALAPSIADAHTVGADLLAGAARAPGEGASTPFLGFNLAGSVELRRQSLNVDAAYSVLNDGSTGARHLFTAGLEYLPIDKWSFAIWGIGGPPRTGRYPAGRSPPDVTRLGGVFEVSDWSAGLNGAVAYDSFGESNFEWQAELAAGVLHYAADQTEASPNPLRPSDERSVSINQLRLSAGLTAVLFRATDVNLRAHWYGYDASPLVAGFIHRASQPPGRGVPVSPLRLELRPSVTHRFARRWWATVEAGLGRYVEGGDVLQAVLQAGFRPTDALRVFAWASGQRDAFARGETSLSGFTGLGADIRF